MSDEDPPGSFGHGIAVGIAISAALVHIVYFALGPDWTSFYRDIGKATLPLMTRVSISTPWQLGVPVIASLLIGWLTLRRPRSLAPYVAVAAALLVAAACTYWFPSLPLHPFSDSVK
jgi:hypothetical protein